jgi:hypothetical protein
MLNSASLTDKILFVLLGVDHVGEFGWIRILVIRIWDWKRQ